LYGAFGSVGIRWYSKEGRVDVDEILYMAQLKSWIWMKNKIPRLIILSQIGIYAQFIA